MKHKTHRIARGIAQTVVLAAAMGVGITLASYVTVAFSHTVPTPNLIAWDHATQVAKAGIHEATVEISDSELANLSAQNWILGRDGAYHKSTYVGKDGSFCVVTVRPIDPPVILAKSYVPLPSKSSFMCRKVRAFTQHARPAKDQALLSGSTRYVVARWSEL